MDADYLRLAAHAAATKSHDPRTQNGAVLVLRDGYYLAANHYPVSSWRQHAEPPHKYDYIEHAERAVIYEAARDGRSCLRSALYCPWFACPDCARAIVVSGVSEVVGCSRLRALTPDRWRARIEIADRMLEDAGVEIRMVDEVLGVRLLFDGREVEV